MKFLQLPWYALIYLSVVTVLTETALMAALWAKGNLSEDTMLQILAVANDVDLHTIRRRQERKNSSAPVRVSLHDVEKKRKAVALDLSMREIAIDKGLVDIREISGQFNRQWEAYKQLKDGFDWKLEQLRQGATDQAVVDVRRQLASLHPRLAKVQILKIMDDPALEQDEALQFVVTVFKGLPIKNREKIIEQFRVEDSERLHEILRQIRKGEPDVGLFRETRRKLKDFD